MADDVVFPIPDLTTVAADEVGGKKYQRVKISVGADGSAADNDASNPIHTALTAAQLSTLTPPAAITGFATATLQGGGLPVALGAGGGVKVDGSGTALPVSIASLPSGAVTNAGTFAVQDTVLDAAIVSQGTALGTIKLPMVGGSVTTAAPTYTTGQINPLSLDTTGALRVNVTAGGAGGGAVTVADGADVTLGAKADAKSTATDTTSVSAMSVLKQISASVQAPPTQAVTLATAPALVASSAVIGHVIVDTAPTTAVTIASVPSHAITNAGTFATQVDGAALTALQLIDDTVVAQGTALGTTKNSLIGGSVTTAAPTYTTGQINPLSLDTSGALRVTGAGGGTQYTEDVAAASDPVGNMLIAVRRDTLSASEVSADGDNVAVKATSKGQLHVFSTIDPASVNANGSATSANSAPVVLASDQAWPVGTTGFMKKEDVASADGDAGIPAMAIQKATPVDTGGTDGDYTMLQMSGGRIWVDASGKTLTVAAHAVTVASAGIASGAIASGAVASGAFASGAIGSGAVASGAFASGALASGSIASGAIVDLVAEQTPIAAATATATKGLLVGGQYDSTQKTLTNGQQGGYSMSARGAMFVAVGADGFAVTNAGTFAVQATNTPLTNMGAGEYETVAASQTAQVLGATGGTGDYISGILVVPATTSPGNVLLLDNATSITVFAGGASSVSNLVPFFIPLGMISVSGAWKISTGANVSCIGIGNFT